MDHQAKFEQAYITSIEIGQLLKTSRATIADGKRKGKLPNSIEVYGGKLTIWEREYIMPFVLSWKDALEKRRHKN